MNLPPFIKAFPALDVPFPSDIVETHAIRSDAGLVVFFDFHNDMELPPHSHLAQWGTLLDGEIEMTIAGVTENKRPGDTWDIPADAEHSAIIKAGSKAIDVFEEADRYPVKS